MAMLERPMSRATVFVPTVCGWACDKAEDVKELMVAYLVAVYSSSMLRNDR
jgi:hypothetical protein